MNVQPDPALVAYLEQEILPRYATFDAAHQENHVRTVIAQSLNLARIINESAKYMNADGTKTIIDIDMAYTIAAYHDTGLVEGRDTHHIVSARIIRADKKLLQWFTKEQIEIMADAAEDHRASAKSAPRTIYGRIVAEADRFIDPVTIVRRTVQYGLDHYPELSREEQYQRMVTHLKEKYGRNGYLKLWFPDSPNAERLERLHDLVDDETQLKELFNGFFD